jgi:aminoglycoside phosphotransferase (APT) family kinase protein
MALPASRPEAAPDAALLARADWRFLLPGPPEGGFAHLALLGGPEGLAELLLEAGFARQVSRSLPGPGAADAVAVLDGAGVPPAEAARHLAPGGALYCELGESWRPSLPAGVTPTGLYAVWPRFAGARAWLPLDPAGALPWFLDTLYPASTPRKRAVELALTALPDPRRACRLLTRCFALTAAAGPRRWPPASLLAHPDLPATVRRGEVRPLLLAHGRERLTLLPFPGGAERPGVVLKVPRLPRFNAAAEQEQEVLSRIRAVLPAALAASLPRPLGLLRGGGLAAAVESCAPGRSLLRSSGAWGAPAGRRVADLELAAGWLAAFHRAGALSRGPWGAREAEAWVAAPLEAFRRRFGAAPAEERLFGLALERAAALAGASVPTVWLHRDFTPWNLLREGRDLAVIDWEGARPGPPLCDLLHFAVLWQQAARGIFYGAERLPARLAAFRELFVLRGGGDYEESARRSLTVYCRRLDLDARLLPVLLVATWAELAVRRAAPGGREATPEAAYVAVLAEGAGRLLAPERAGTGGWT